MKYVIDMPETKSCAKCPLSSYEGLYRQHYWWCRVGGKKVPDMSEDSDRPDWCPLKTVDEARTSRRKIGMIEKMAEVDAMYGDALKKAGILEPMSDFQVFLLYTYIYERVHHVKPRFPEARPLDAKSLFGFDVDLIIFDELGGDDA